ncbi:MAG: cytidine deaminase [Thermoleophilia bacterium]
MVPALGRPADAAEERALGAALLMAERAYAPYSGFRVGAVIVDAAGSEYRGVNVENASYPAGLCAERAALAALIAAGGRRPLLVAVAAASGDDCLPCGVCLQALAEFGDPTIVARVGGAPRAIPLHELLTAPFAHASGAAAEREAGR